MKNKVVDSIFISYRRSDSADVTGRIYDHLIAHFNRESIFKDVDSIPAGVDFRQYIADAVGSCVVVVAIIGDSWLKTTCENGTRRLDDPDDFVRLELETALKQNIPLIPAILGACQMPKIEDLPPSLQELSFRHAVRIRSDPDFKADVWKLVKELRRFEREPRHILKNWRTWLTIFIVLFTSTLAWLGTHQADINKVPISVDSSDETSSGSVKQELPNAKLPEVIYPYDPNFLGKINIPLPTITDDRSAGDFLGGQVFDYIHYSLVIDERTAMPLYVASNIDRRSYISIPREGDHWQIDSRVPRDLQRGDTVYMKNEWDRGHLVNRSSVTWGKPEEARAASLAVFYYTNTVPQHAQFNQGIWADLEEYVQVSLRPDALRLSVFAGPVHQKSDYEYRGARIPQSFWKIVAVADPKNQRNLFVYAYLMNQYTIGDRDNLIPTERSRTDAFEAAQYQVSVGTIESLTSLRFGILKDFDTFGKKVEKLNE